MRHANSIKVLVTAALVLLIAALGLGIAVLVKRPGKEEQAGSAAESVSLPASSGETAPEEGAESTAETGEEPENSGETAPESASSGAEEASESTAAEETENPERPEDLTFLIDEVSDGDFYSYDDMMEDLASMAYYFPDRTTLRTLGETADGREIPEAVLGDPESETHLIFQYTMHAREYINSLLAMRQLEDYLLHYDEPVIGETTYRELFEKVCFHVIPMDNPDGVMISQEGPEAIRDEELRDGLEAIFEYDDDHGYVKGSREQYWRRWKANARGVDVNRNFDSGWDGYSGHGAPSTERYKGEAPGSEAESRIILALEKEYPVAACISYHSAGGTVYWDYGSSGDIYDRDKELVNIVTMLTGYSASSSVVTSQDAAGCSDYFVLELEIPAVTIETGSGNCPLPAGDLEELWEENRLVWPSLANRYGREN